MRGRLVSRRLDAEKKPESHDEPADVAPAPDAGAPLPPAVRVQMERQLGADFSLVRVHEGPQGSAVGSVAYTRGTDIHFAPGAYTPGTAQGDQLIAHELAHVVQQRQGRVDGPTEAGPGAGP
jgi:hypothetical protein